MRYIGSSNLTGWQIVDADWTARTGGYEAFISAQNEYSWLDRSAEAELIPAVEHGPESAALLPPGPWTAHRQVRRDEPPPAGSRLVAQPDHLDRANFDTVEALAGFAAERNLDLVTVAIGGLAAMPTVGSVIAGATSVEQVQSNVAAGLWSPTPAELLELLEMTEPA